MYSGNNSGLEVADGETRPHLSIFLLARLARVSEVQHDIEGCIR